MPLTKEDLSAVGQVIREQVPPLVEGIIEKRVSALIEAAVEPHFRAIAEDLGRVEGKIDTLTTTLDGFAHTVRRHEEEWLVLRAQHQKMRDLLVKKGIATEDELALA